MNNYTILVAESNKTERLAIVSILESAGYSVLQADNGHLALDMCNEFSPDMIVMDAHLSGMSGYELAEEIKKITMDRFVPVLFVTAMRDAESLVKCIDSGGDDYIQKPFEISVFIVKIMSLRRIQSMHKELLDANKILSRRDADLQSELSLAEHVYSYMLGKVSVDSRVVEYYHSPLTRFSGDVFFSSYTPSGALNVMLCDFSGHGLYAAIGAIPVGELFYAMSKKGFSIEDIINEINRKLYEIFPVEMFCAAVLVEVSPACDYIKVWNGGMPDVYIRDANGVRVLVKSKTVPLGVCFGSGFDASPEVFGLVGGENLYFISDGLWPVDGNDKNISLRFLEVLDSLDGDEEFDLLCREVSSLIPDGVQTDDISFVRLNLSVDLFFQKNEKLPDLIESVPCHWSVDMRFHKDVFKDVNLAPVVSNIINSVQPMNGHKENIFTVVSELINNAVDHGVLGLDSSIKKDAEGFSEYFCIRDERLHDGNDGWISVSLNHTSCDGKGVLEMSVADSGGGFNPLTVKNNISANSAFHGRGLSLVDTLCDGLVFNEAGNSAKVVYRWGSSRKNNNV